MSTYDLLAVGDVMVDVVAPAPEAAPRHAPVEIRAGGSAVNAALAATRAGRRAAVVGCVGDDALARLVREELEAAGVEPLLAAVEPARTGRVLYAGTAVVAERGANACFAARHVPAVDARAVLVSGYQLFRDDSGRGAEAALALDALVGVDLGAAGLVARYGSARARRLLERTDVIVGGEAAVAELGEVPGALVVTTLGADGARAAEVHIRPRRVVAGPLVGAGDAFAAVLLVALADGAAVTDALASACAAGGAVRD